jgi:2-methylisocitrate lyase-like PEP mutase family enzyme
MAPVAGTTDSVQQLAQKCETLRRLHDGPSLLVLPNAWDAATARAFVAAGFPAIATTSGGVAQAVGFEDHENAPADEMFAAARRITAAVDVPVTVDLEAGYGLSPEEFVQRAIEAGAAGFNLEDSDHRGSARMVPAEQHAERIAAVKSAGKRAGVDFVLNARIDPLLHRSGTIEEQLAETISRGRLYREAGADCLYPFGFFDETIVAALVEGLGTPINILSWKNSVPLARLAELGVRRVTFGTSLFRQIMTSVTEMAADIRSNLPSQPDSK